MSAQFFEFHAGRRENRGISLQIGQLLLMQAKFNVLRDLRERIRLWNLEQDLRNRSFGTFRPQPQIPVAAVDRSGHHHRWYFLIDLVVILVCVYQKGKKVDSSNKVKPTLL